MLAVMDGDSRLLPFLFALKSHRLCSQILQFLIASDLRGRELVTVIKHRFGSNDIAAVHGLSVEVEKRIGM